MFPSIKWTPAEGQRLLPERHNAVFYIEEEATNNWLKISSVDAQQVGKDETLLKNLKNQGHKIFKKNEQIQPAEKHVLVSNGDVIATISSALSKNAYVMVLMSVGAFAIENLVTNCFVFEENEFRQKPFMGEQQNKDMVSKTVKRRLFFCEDAERNNLAMILTKGNNICELGRSLDLVPFYTKILYELFKKPSLIMSLYGTAQGLSGEIVEEFSRSCITIAANTNAWMLINSDDKDLHATVRYASYESKSNEIPILSLVYEDTRFQDSVRSGIQDIDTDAVPEVMLFIHGDQDTTLDHVKAALESDIAVVLVHGTDGYVDTIVKKLKTEMPLNANGLVDRMEQIRRLFAAKPHLVTFCHCTEDFEKAFIKALLKAYDNPLCPRSQKIKRLESAVKIDGNNLVSRENAAEEFKALHRIISCHSQDEIENIIETALLYDHTKVIEFILNRDWLKLKSLTNDQSSVDTDAGYFFSWNTFLSLDRFYYLYNSDGILNRERSKFLGFVFSERKLLKFKDIKKFAKQYTFSVDIAIFPDDKDDHSIERFVENAKEHHRKGLPVKYENENGNAGVKHLMMMENLFIWALLFQKYDMAILFWVQAKDQISLALFACKLLRSVAKQLDPELRKMTCEQSKKFEDLAIAVMTLFDNNTNSFMNSVILLNSSSFASKTDNLKMAVECGCKKFISQGAVQDFLTEIWYGGVKRSSIKKGVWNWIKYSIAAILRILFHICTLSIFIPVKVNLNIEERKYKWYWRFIASIGLMGDKKVIELTTRDLTIIKKLDNIKTGVYKNYYRRFDIKNLSRSEAGNRYFEDWKSFFLAPVTRYFIPMIVNVCFLVLLAYHTIYLFSKETNTAVKQNSTQLLANSSKNETSSKLVSYTNNETYMIVTSVLHIWIASLFITEVKQAFTDEQAESTKTSLAFLKLKIWKPLKIYLNNEWNLLDIFGILIYMLAFVLRDIHSESVKDGTFETARILMTIDLVAWFIRFTQFFLVSENLGPKLVMLRKMLSDIYFFLATLVIFLLSFGIFTIANIEPNLKSNQLFYQIVHKAFWPIFGDLDILQDTGLACKNDTVGCENNQIFPSYGAIASYVLLMVYMIVANILLINLLIALFNSTYKKIEEDYDAVWRFNRYKLTLEFVNYPVLPIPISILDHIYDFGCFLSNKWFFSSNKLNPDQEDDTSRTEDGLTILERKFAYDCWRKIKTGND